MSVRSLLSISLLLASMSAGCTGSPTQTDGIVTITQTTSTTTSTTTMPIPPVRAGAIGTAPTGVGVAWATVYTFSFVAPASGGVPPYTYTWEFGDGAMGAGSTPSHAYMNTGNFTAIVTATDTMGMSDKASVPVVVRNVTGTWRATLAGTDFNREPIDIVQNQTAVTAAINSTNTFGLASGAGNVSNPRSLAISATFMGPMPFAVTYVGRLDETLLMWSGTASGYPGCPCPFTATRPNAGDLSLGR